MALFERHSLTNAGRSLIAKAQAGRTTINFTKAVSGAGLWEEAEDISAATQLKTPKQNFTFSEITIPPGNNSTVVLKVILSNVGLTELYYVTELGIYAEDPDDGEVLYAILTSSRRMEYLPAENGIGTSAITVRLNIEVFNAANVTVVMAGALVSAEDFDVIRNIVNLINNAITGGNTGQILRKTANGNYLFGWDDEKVEVTTQSRENFPETGAANAIYVDVDSSSIYIWKNGAYFKLPLGAEAAETLQRQITELQNKFYQTPITALASAWTETTEDGVSVYSQNINVTGMTENTMAKVWTRLISNDASVILLEQKAQAIFTGHGKAYSQNGYIRLKCYGKCPAHDFGLIIEGK